MRSSSDRHRVAAACVGGQFFAAARHLLLLIFIASHTSSFRPPIRTPSPVRASPLSSANDNDNDDAMGSFLEAFYRESEQMLYNNDDLGLKEKRDLSMQASPLIGGHRPVAPSPFYSPDFVVQHLLSTIKQEHDPFEALHSFTKIAPDMESRSLRVSWADGFSPVTLSEFSRVFSSAPHLRKLPEMDDFSFAGLPVFGDDDLSCYLDIYARDCRTDEDSCMLGMYRFHLTRESKLPAANGGDCWLVAHVQEV